LNSEPTSARLPTAAGEFQLHFFGEADGQGHLAVVHGEVAGRRDLLVRVHSECFTGEALGSLRCDCGPQLTDALWQIAAEGTGVLVYLRQEGRGIGLRDKLRAYNLQDAGHDTVDANLMLGHPADDRDYSVAADILRRLGVGSVRLLTNNPAKIESLRAHGIAVSRRVPTQLHVNAENTPYLLAKARRMRHLLDVEIVAEGGAAPVATLAVEDDRDQGLVVDAAPTPALVAPPTGLEALGQRLARHRRRDAAQPFVTLSYAQSVDGCIAATADRPLALSGQASLTLTHAVRALHDAILVGVGTVVADDPRLTVRLVTGAQPRPVVVDGTLRTPPGACLLRSGTPPLIATTAAADPARQRRLEAAGAEVVRLPADATGRVSLPALLDQLSARGHRSVMVEGGSGIITSFLGSRLVDHLVLTVAPLLVGGLRGVQGLDTTAVPRLRNVVYQPLGEDLVMWADPLWGPA
jgi:GTP cyclohydrolase II